jgi:hypothetical protein
MYPSPLVLPAPSCFFLYTKHYTTLHFTTPRHTTPHHTTLYVSSCKQIPFKEEKSKDRDNESNRSMRSMVSSSNMSGLTAASRTPPTLEETLDLFDVFFDMVEIARIR